MDKKRRVPGGTVTLKLSTLLLSVMTLTGCASFGVGDDEYNCSGIPDGTRCMSARDVYNSSNEVNETQLIISGANRAHDEVYDDYVAPRLPNQPIPIRTPSKVMRIWIAPWEDNNGDLIVSGHIYTEIEPRKWVIGDKLSSSEIPSLFQPLQVTKTTK